jgi:hypothetical protein
MAMAVAAAGIAHRESSIVKIGMKALQTLKRLQGQALTSPLVHATMRA